MSTLFEKLLFNLQICMKNEETLNRFKVDCVRFQRSISGHRGMQLGPTFFGRTEMMKCLRFGNAMIPSLRRVGSRERGKSQTDGTTFPIKTSAFNNTRRLIARPCRYSLRRRKLSKGCLCVSLALLLFPCVCHSALEMKTRLLKTPALLDIYSCCFGNC